jgi:hypothetical protein
MGTKKAGETSPETPAVDELATGPGPRGDRSAHWPTEGRCQRVPDRPNYNTLRLRLENAHAAAEAATVGGEEAGTA